MRSDVPQDRVLLALARAIEAKFDRSDWMELGLLTGTSGLISEHPRLLRSLDWGDDDYRGRIIEVLPKILGARKRSSGSTAADSANLTIVEDFVGLSAYLQNQDPGLYAELYGSDDDGIDELQAASEELGLEDVSMHAARIRRGMREDPGLAIGASKELLETVLKAVLGLRGSGPETRVDIPKLLARANERLGLSPSAHRGTAPGAEQTRKLLGALSTIVLATAELRNAGFGTGHGGVERPELDLPTARLVVTSAVALATFYIEAHATEAGHNGR